MKVIGVLEGHAGVVNYNGDTLAVMRVEFESAILVREANELDGVSIGDVGFRVQQQGRHA